MKARATAIGSPGGGGSVTQVNGSLAASAAGNLNSTDQTADQSAGGSGGGVTVQALGQKAVNGQQADSRATSEQDGASNTNSPVRIKSKGDDGDVKQINASAAKSAAGNDNQTTQSANQAAGWGGVNVQALGQKAWNGQGARSNATSDQYDPSNANAPVREHSMGGGGSVLQANASLALSAAGNRNSTCQIAAQGSGGAPLCERIVREPVHAMEVD